MVADIKALVGVKYDSFQGIFDYEKPVDDISGTYNLYGIGNFNLKFLDTTYLKDGIAYFRPVIRGFLVLLMLLYHVRQLIGFFGYNSGAAVEKELDRRTK